MNKLIKNISCIILLAVAASCNSTKKNDGTATDSITVEHKLGKAQVVASPSHIVVFDIGALETLDQLGVPVAGVPKDNIPDHLIKYKNDEAVANVGSVKEPNYERINALNPDLILISSRQEKFYDELNKIAPTVFVGVDDKDYMSSFRKNTLLIGQLVGKEAEAKSKLDAINEKLKTAQGQLKGDNHKALIILHNNGRFSAYGKGSRFGFIHDVLGVKPAQEQLEVAIHGQKISNEFIAETNPDYLFIIDRNAVVAGKAGNKSEIENKLIQQTNAYKNGKLIYLNPQIWYLSGGGITSTDMMIDEIIKALK
ncbi:siderophore ABC transporter substrate-binding protein [Sphingobacterium spiritivorum]|uniref:siderophore ABC transporter substrate-binding protein n=1 Tax=Sphingobacterium spiritivorum TaxID=258 RepID=UPI003DA67863